MYKLYFKQTIAYLTKTWASYKNEIKKNIRKKTSTTGKIRGNRPTNTDVRNRGKSSKLYEDLRNTYKWFDHVK
jgi:hypothetical protein